MDKNKFDASNPPSRSLYGAGTQYLPKDAIVRISISPDMTIYVERKFHIATGSIPDYTYDSLAGYVPYDMVNDFKLNTHRYIGFGFGAANYNTGVVMVAIRRRFYEFNISYTSYIAQVMDVVKT